ncbi:MAG TPA: ATP-dependent helicase [Trebonia sp.]
MNPDELLSALDPEQRAVALATRGPVCVLAGAGTGKTRAITHRIAYAVATGAVNPAQVMALTFTVRAAGELRGRLRALGAETVRASTFHAAALRQLTYFWPRVIGGRAPQLVESKLPLLREAAASLGLRLDGPAVSDAVTEIEWAKVCQVHPDSYAFAAAEAGRAPSAGVEDAGRLYAAYEGIRRDRQLIDFEAVLELTAAIVLTEPLVAREVQAAFTYFTVDEFQDVNPLQKLLLDAWLGDREELCVVGDPRQTIYSFTGATPEYLRSFSADYPQAALVRLVRDYRSTPQVVDTANRLVAGSDGSGELIAQRPPGPDPVILRYADDEAEAAGTAAAIATLTGARVPPGEIAVLVRINAQLERFERALGEAGIRYIVRGGERFYDRPEVRKALVLLRGASRAAGAGNDATGLPGELPAAVRHVLASAGLTAAPPAGRGAVRERWESLAAIAALAENMTAARPQATLAEFAAELVEREETGHAPGAAAVTLATMHAAKGLEWDAVLLPGLTEGIMPIVHARTSEAVEEERRLLYVAVTRARVHLTLSWAAARTPGTEGARQRSRFLAGLPGAGPSGGRTSGTGLPRGAGTARTPAPRAAAARSEGRSEGRSAARSEGRSEGRRG